MRRLFTRLTPQVRNKGYALECAEFIDAKGERGLKFSVSFKDAKGNWHVPNSVYFWESMPQCWKKDLIILKSDLKKERFKL